jgi:hypothetical protein
MTRTDPTCYQRRIAEHTSEVDPRHVEAWMRLEHPTLDGLSAAELEREIDLAVMAIAAAGTTGSEALAASFGL